MRVSLLLSAALLTAACSQEASPDPLPEPDPGADGSDGSVVDTADTGTDEPPCDCDDGLFCNGVETCDEDGACLEGTPPEPEDDGDPCTAAGECNEDEDAFDLIEITDDPRCTALPTLPLHNPLDVAAWYWPVNHDAGGGSWNGTSHLLSGHYGLAFNEKTGSIEHFGALGAGLVPSDLLAADNSIVEALPAAELRFEGSDGIVATAFQGVNPGSRNRTRMLDGGHTENWFVIPNVRYAADGGLRGRVELSAGPRHVVFTHSLQGTDTARISLGGALFDGLTSETWLATDRALQLTDAAGEGWLLIVQPPPDGTALLRRESDGRVVAQQTGGAADATVSLLVTPVTAWNADEVAMLLDPSTVSVQTALLDKDGTEVWADTAATWDSTLGAYRADLGTLRQAGAPSRWANWEDPANHHWYGRHRVTVTPSGTEPVAVPLAFHGLDQISFYITGGAAMLRGEDGLPTGIPVQHSKNWHADGSYGDGPWYHLSALPTVSAPTTLELTVASGKWGPAWVASHAQLSLIGWSDAGGNWQESALGAFGESVTYDPDETLRRAMVDDVRPFLVQADRKWNWTGNVGGADFLRYVPGGASSINRLGRVRTWTRSPGPLLTDVVWSGVSADGHIKGEITSQLGTADDLVRVWLHFSYTIEEDTPYERFALFQLAADRYADNLFQTASYGDAAGTVDSRPVPDHGTTGYASDAVRGIALTGAAPWILLSDNTRDWDTLPEHLADVGFIVRHFEADIGGTALTTPHLNLHQTNNRHSQYGFELGLPHEEGSPWCGAPCGGETRFLPAGSTLEATIEYLVIPNDPSTYYGESPHLLSVPSEDWGTPAMMVHLADGGQLTLEASVGTVVRTHPVEVAAEPGKVAAEFSLTGGLGYTPLTVHGLNRHDGWTLWVSEDGGAWAPVPGEVLGNDHTQAHQAEDGTWSLTWAVANQGTSTYRLEWAE